jgi:AGZA family xanthine/uracil permease-like MFS transporter
VLEKLVLWRHCHHDECEAHPHEMHSHGPTHQQRDAASASLILIGDGFHNALDGVLIAAAFLTDVHLGIVTAIGLLVPDGKGSAITKLPQAWIAWPASLEPTFLKLNFDLILTDHLKALPIILTLLLVDMFDNLGTLIGVTRRAGLMDAQGNIPRVGRALVADSTAAIISALFGTSTVVSYIESAAGIQAGGRTGLTALTTAVCFLLALFLTPIILMVPGAAVAPALVAVGLVMFEEVVNLDLRNFEMAAPAILTILMMPLSFSISTGIGLGLIMLSALSLVSKTGRQATAVTHVLAIIFLLHFFEPLIVRWVGGR